MLVFISFLVQVLAFYLLYNSSSKANQQKPSWMKNRKIPKAAGVLLLAASVVALIFTYSISITAIVALTSMMTVLSVMVIAIPLFKPQNARKS